MSDTNSVLKLRTQELAKATRVFNARGSKVKRCEQCLLPATDCICASKPSVSSHCAFCFIMYTGECYKPSNTGRIIADVIADVAGPTVTIVRTETAVAKQLQQRLAQAQLLNSGAKVGADHFYTSGDAGLFNQQLLQLWPAVATALPL